MSDINDLIKKSKESVISERIEYLKNTDMYTDEQLIEIKRYLTNKLSDRQMLTYKVNEFGKTVSKHVNDTTENLYYDMYTIFKTNDELSNIVDGYITASLFNINNVNTKLDKCIDKLNDFNEILKTKGNPKIITENFRSNSSFEVNNNLYKERYDETINISNHNHYDYSNSRITLPILLKSNTVMYDNGVSAGTISIKKKIGENFLNINTPTSIDSITDTSFKSFWKSSTLTDSPVKIEYSNIRPSDTKLLGDFYYGIKSGALLELELIYESICTINCIEITPCTKYPMELIAIRYSDTNDIESDLKEIVFPDNDNEMLRSKILNGTVIYNFENITCKRIYFIFNQINYERRNFIVNTNEVIKNEIWLDINKNDKKIASFIDSDKIFKPNYLERKISSGYLNNFNKFANTSTSINFFELFYDNNKIFKPVLKNCYEHGFYNISTYYLDYNYYGVYVSSFIDINKNIESISIITDEVHCKSSDGRIDTDIEYYISYSEDPKYNNWFSILPKNIDYIYSELLQLETDECILRFPTEKVDTIYMNDILLIENIDYTPHYEGDYVRTIEIPNFNHRAIYKASYQPTKDATDLRFANINDLPNIISNTDSIQCNGECIYELKNVPYIDFENSTHVRIINRETGYVAFEEGYNIYCCTDLVETDKSYKNFFDSENLKYQYYTYDNKIVFNNPISSSYKIEVTYKCHISKFRLKAIMRRNNRKDSWLTPILNKIEYSVTVI